MNSRRKFIFDSSAVMAALTVIPMSSFGALAAAPGFSSLDQMGYSVLAGQINSIFRVRTASGQTVELKLVKAPLSPLMPVVPGRRLPEDAGNEKFPLIFSGPTDAPLPSAIHQFEHPQLGRFEMYVGEIGLRDGESVRYESVFNRPAPAAWGGTNNNIKNQSIIGS